MIHIHRVVTSAKSDWSEKEEACVEVSTTTGSISHAVITFKELRSLCLMLLRQSERNSGDGPVELRSSARPDGNPTAT